ncbi:threonine--tRNA ligase [Candidatus Dependentiae bacterium]|nr:threonine--tRNA ligase [Candidatus Dependentiae bacterium]
MKNEERLHNLRHSAAHLLAQAVLELFPGTKITIGPVTKTGFFYDFLPPENFKEDDLPKIEEKMRQLAKQDFAIKGKQVSHQEAKELFKDNEFKIEIIEGLDSSEPITIYSQGNFIDLCKGGHVASTGELGHFKLLGVSGSYWRADREGIPLQRISGVVFESKDDFEQYVKRVEEAKLYDHRRLGKQLDLFSFHEEAPGIVFFHAKGMKIFNNLVAYLRKLQDDAGYQEVRTPLVLHESLWKTSGHYENYKENMFFTNIEKATHCVRPMNCPGGVLLYKERPHSYRELPLRVAEFGVVHRCELSGVLHGMFRVRGFTMDDAHIYCTPDQVADEVAGVLKLTTQVYKKFGFENLKMALATRPEKSIGSDELWQTGIDALKVGLETSGFKYEINEGEGAFYGPKIEIHIKDAMGREWQCGTVQVDFFLPQNFDIEYIDSDQSRKRPVMIHRAIYGSLERFIGILTEHYRGHFPFWLAPVQACVLTITDKQMEYAGTVLARLKSHGIRVELDESGDQISAQIRHAQLDKIPWMVVIGKKEEAQGTVTLRHVDGKQEFGLTVEDLLARAKELNK